MALVAKNSRFDLAVVVRLEGRVDGETAGDLTHACQQSVQPGDRHMILDFTNVEYISSAGLSAVLGAGKQMSAQDGDLLIFGLNPRLKNVFTISGFSALFPLCESEQEAFAECRE